jgi:hypothetical protein
MIMRRGQIRGWGLSHLAARDFLVAAGGGSAATARTTRAPIRLVFGGALGAAFFVDQRLPVGDGDLVVIGMNFAESKKAVTVAAVIDKRGLQ